MGVAVNDARRAGPDVGYWVATPVILILLGAIGMSEIDRLVTGALTPLGESRSVTDVVGLAFLGGRDSWDIWEQVSNPQQVAFWIGLHAAFDIALYAGYGWLLWKFVKSCWQAKQALKVLLGLEVVETIGLWIAAGQLAGGDVPAAPAWILSIVATAKWIAAGFLALAILVDKGRRSALRDGGMRLLTALKKQRLSFLVVAIFGILSIVPLPNIWDQLPDVQRSWLDGAGQGLRHAIWAAGATFVVSVYLFVLGRMRAERLWSEYAGTVDRPRKSWRWKWWLASAVALWLVALALFVLDQGVAWLSLVIASALPLAVLGLSLVVPARTLSERKPSLQLANNVWLAGDLLAASLWVLAGLGLVRSLLAPVLLGREGQRQDFVVRLFGERTIGSVWSVRLGVLICGAIVAVLVIPLIVEVTRWLRPGPASGKFKRFLDPSQPTPPRKFAFRVGFGLIVVAALSLLGLMLAPTEIAGELGVAATTLLALGAWALILGLMIVWLQGSDPAPCFGSSGCGPPRF